MADTNVLPDDVLAALALPPRGEWTPPQWLTFMEGWSFQRIGSPPYGSNKADVGGFFSFGRFEAKHFATVPS